MRNRFGLLAIAAAMGLGAVAPGFSQPAPTVTAAVSAKRKKGLFNRMPMASLKPWTYLNHGPTMAQQKRASIKVRNVAKHRRHA